MEPFNKNHFDVEDKEKLLETIRPNFDKLDLEKDATNHIDLLDINPEANKILEIGCGVGRLLNIIGRTKDAYGIEPSSGMIKHSSEFCKNAKILSCSGNGEIPFSDNFFDCVYSIITFQHIPLIETVKKYISESYRVLNEGQLIFQLLDDSSIIDEGILKNYHSSNELIDYMKYIGFKDIKKIKKGSQWIFIYGKKD